MDWPRSLLDGLVTACMHEWNYISTTHQMYQKPCRVMYISMDWSSSLPDGFVTVCMDGWIELDTLVNVCIHAWMGLEPIRWICGCMHGRTDLDTY